MSRQVKVAAMIAAALVVGVGLWALIAPSLIHDHDLRSIVSIVLGVVWGRIGYLTWEVYR